LKREGQSRGQSSRKKDHHKKQNTKLKTQYASSPPEGKLWTPKNVRKGGSLKVREE